MSYLKHIYQNKLDEACFAHNGAYSDSKDLPKNYFRKDLKRQSSTGNPNYDGYQTGLTSMTYKLFDKKTRPAASANEGLTQQLHKPVIKTFKRKDVYARFKHNIWAVDFAEMGHYLLLIMMFNIYYVSQMFS